MRVFSAASNHRTLCQVQGWTLADAWCLPTAQALHRQSGRSTADSPKNTVEAIEEVERETGLEPATSSLGKCISIVNRELRRPWRCFLVNKISCFQAAASDILLNKVNEVAVRADSAVLASDVKSGRSEKSVVGAMNESTDANSPSARVRKVRQPNLRMAAKFKRMNSRQNSPL